MTEYECGVIERAVDCIRAGCSPRNLDELADTLERALLESRRALSREAIYNAPASKALLEAVDSYGVPVFVGDTVGQLLKVIVESERKAQERARKKKRARTGG